MKILAGLASLWSIVCAQVYPLPYDTITQLSADRIQINMTELFNYSFAPSSITFSSTVGTVQDNTTMYGVTDVTQYGFKSLDFLHFINNQSFVAIYDNSHILAQTISLDGMYVTNTVFNTFSIPGSGAMCTDADFNANLSRIYVACYSPTTETNLGIVYVAEFDSVNGSIINTNTIPLTASFSANHTIRLQIMTISQGSTISRIVVVYDQGLSATNTTKNFWLGVLTGVDNGNLKFAGFVDLKANQYPLTSFFDAFNYNNKIVLTGFLETANVITLLSCSLNSNLTLACSQPTQSTVKVGYVGIFNTGQLVLVSLTGKTYFQICDLVGPIEQRGWTNCQSTLDIDIISNGYITEVVGNNGIIMIKYDDPMGDFLGYTVCTWLLDPYTRDYKIPVEWTSTDPNTMATVINQHIYIANLTTTWNNWIHPPALVIDCSRDLSKDTVVKVTAILSPTVSNTTQFVINYMPTVFDYVTLNPYNLGNLNAYEGASYEIELDQDAIQGNYLTYNISFQPSVQQYIIPFIYDTKTIGVLFDNVVSSSFVEVTFFDRFAASIDYYGNLVAYNCQQSNSLVSCNSFAQIPIRKDEVLQKRMFELFGAPVVWTITPTHTHVYFLFQSAQVVRHSFEGSAIDLVVTQLDADGFVVASFVGVLQHFHLVQNNPSYIDYLPAVTQSNSFSEFFCPTTLYFCPDGNNVLEVLSSCDSPADRRMLKYTYWPTSKGTKWALRNTIPLNLRYFDSQFCPMGGEFIISSVNSSTVFGLPTYWENAHYDFGLKDVNLGSYIKVDCVPTLAMFSVVSTLDHNNVMVTVFEGNTQYQANERASTQFFLGNVQDVTNHNLFGNVIHVIKQQDGSYTFMMTYSEPYINFKILPGIGAGNFPLNIMVTNNKTGQSMSLMLKVETFNYGITLTSTSTGLPNPVGVIDLENYVKINGVFFDASIVGATSDQVSLIPRVSHYHSFIPSQGGRYVFQHVESYQELNLAMHVVNNNQFYMSLFSNWDQFHYTFNPFPGIGITGYAFARIPSDNYHETIFLAFCSANQSVNFLEVLVINNGTVQNTGRYTGNYGVDCSKVKVVKKDNQGSSFYVVVHDGYGSDLMVFNAVVTPAQISVYLVDDISNVVSFGVAKTSSYMYVVLVQADNKFSTYTTSYSVQTSLTEPVEKPLVQSKNNLKFFDGNYSIFAVECTNLNDTAFACVYDTYSTNLYEQVILEHVPNPITTYEYKKIPDYDGRYFVMTPTYFAVLGMNTRRTDFDIFFYRRMEKGGNGQAWASIKMDGRAPYTMYDRANGTTSVAFATNIANVPLRFADVGDMKIDIKNTSLDLSQVYLQLSNFNSTTKISLDKIFSGDSTSTPAVAAWFFFLLLGLMVLVGVAYMIWVRIKQDEDNAKTQYGSIDQPRASLA
jgi:hypothetical protein